MQLKGKVALVTGSSRGIGKAIARELAQQSEALTASFEDVKKLSGDSITVTAELSEPAEIDRMFSQIKQALPGLDILVNNAATQKPGAVLELEQDNWDRVLSVNLRAPFLCAQRAGRIMRDKGTG
ncbi:MAG: SDR family NAD(P)-dependent oxidoreductase, partial [Planctomycetota bacterium]